MICMNCGSQIEDGYFLKSDTYGKITIEKITGNEKQIRVSVCPCCGKVELFVNVNSVK